ncbi:MAG: hypothetical protein HY672_03150 [Chloroflexi bacterium]|nr:hypothetical protein [Chloroflexota bacterium]
MLIWCHRVVKGGIELPAKVSFVEGISPVVVDPTEYIIDKLQVLRWIRSSIAVGGIGQWTPAWFTATAARLRENLAALKAVSETSVPGKQGAKKGR